MRVTRGRRYDFASQEVVFDLALKSGLQRATSSANRCRFYPCRVISKKSREFGDGIPKVKVHYVGWGRKFDEWRPISELSHFGFTNYIIRRDGLVEHQLRQISIATQESLNGARRRDTSRSLKVSISERTWTELANVLWVKRVFRKKPTIHGIRKKEDLDRLLGTGWSKRIFNKYGDFSEILPETFQIYVYQKKDLKCYKKSAKGGLTVNSLNRGLFLAIKFLCSDGNSL